MAVNDLAIVRQSRKSAYEVAKFLVTPCFWNAEVINTSLSESGNGRGFNITASTMLKIAVFAPMPKARVNRDMTVNAGDLRSVRSPKRRSCSSVVTHFSLRLEFRFK